MDNKVLIILGMHRSGTSLIAQWLHKCGLQLGDRLMGAGIGNDEGHFEDLDFVSLHESFFVDAGLPASGLMLEPVPELSAYYLEKFKSNITLKHKLHFQWGWKDPRTCLLLPVYKTLIPEAKYIIVYRDFQSVVNSLVKRDFKIAERKFLKNAGWFQKYTWRWRKKHSRESYYRTYATQYLKVWIRYNKAILDFFETLTTESAIVINYLSVLQRGEMIFEALQQKLHAELNYVDFTTVYNKEMLSNPVEVLKYISDQDLIKEAAFLEQRFQRICL